MTSTTEKLIAKQSIAECLYRYCRSLDRMDSSLYSTVFEPGATLEYGDYFTGTAEQFHDWVWKAHETMLAHSHQITNVLVDVDVAEGRAVSEAYVTVCLRTRPAEDGASVDIVDRGRYLDRWVVGAGDSWRIASRKYRSDVQQVADASTAPVAGSVRDRTDPSYEILA